MTFIMDLVQDIDRMKSQGKTTEEIMTYVDEFVWQLNRDTLEQLRLQNMLDGVA